MKFRQLDSIVFWCQILHKLLKNIDCILPIQYFEKVSTYQKINYDIDLFYSKSIGYFLDLLKIASQNFDHVFEITTFFNEISICYSKSKKVHFKFSTSCPSVRLRTWNEFELWKFSNLDRIKFDIDTLLIFWHLGRNFHVICQNVRVSWTSSCLNFEWKFDGLYEVCIEKCTPCTHFLKYNVSGWMTYHCAVKCIKKVRAGRAEALPLPLPRPPPLHFQIGMVRTFMSN